MSPGGQKVVASSNVYTVILAFTCALVLATAVFVAYMCYTRYGVIFTLP